MKGLKEIIGGLANRICQTIFIFTLRLKLTLDDYPELARAKDCFRIC